MAAILEALLKRPHGEARPGQVTTLEHEELRGISRTVAEIHWLLLILVLLYLVFGGAAEDAEVNAAVSAGLFFYAALVMSFRYANFYRRETRWKIAIETWGMIAFVTWVLWFTDRLASPLLNAYLLAVITSALTLGRRDVAAVMLSYAGMLALLAWVGLRLHLGWPYAAGLAAAGAMMVYHWFLIRGRSREGCFKAFMHNNWVGGAIFAGIVFSYPLAWPT